MSAAADGRHAVVIEAWWPIRKNTLRGFARVALPSGMLIADVAVHVSNDQAWASAPSKPMLDQEGVVMRNPDGKTRYSPIVSFSSKEHRNRFSAAVVAAMRAAYPEALS